MTSLAEKLQHLRELGEKASGGPWHAAGAGQPDWMHWSVYDQPSPDSEGAVLGYEQKANALFIAASRLALPKLVEGWDAILKLHSPYALYDECGHDHKEGEPGVTEIDDVGLCCEDRTGTICRECHTTDGEVNEDCWDATYPCPTIEALSKLGEGL